MTAELRNLLQEESRAGVQIGWDTVRGSHEEDDGLAVSLWMTDTGGPAKGAPLVPVGHK